MKKRWGLISGIKTFLKSGERKSFQTKSYLQIEVLGALGPLTHRQLDSFPLGNWGKGDYANQLSPMCSWDKKDM